MTEAVIVTRLEFDIAGIDQDSETYQRALAGAEAYLMKFARQQQKAAEAVRGTGAAIDYGATTADIIP